MLLSETSRVELEKDLLGLTFPWIPSPSVNRLQSKRQEGEEEEEEENGDSFKDVFIWVLVQSKILPFALDHCP